MTDPATLRALAAHQDAPAVRQALEAAAQRTEALEAEWGARPDAAQVCQMAEAFLAVNIKRAFEAFGVEIGSLKEAQTRAAAAEAEIAKLREDLGAAKALMLEAAETFAGVKNELSKRFKP